jgi:hypothetical protein
MASVAQFAQLRTTMQDCCRKSVGTAALAVPEDVDFFIAGLNGEYITIWLHIAAHGRIVDAIR